MPKLKKAVNALEIAIDTGADIAEATQEASDELAAATDDLKQACKGDDICEYNIDHVWLWRNVQWTFDLKNDNSVASKWISKTLARYAPNFICKIYDRCAKELEKQEKAKKN